LTSNCAKPRIKKPGGEPATVSAVCTNFVPIHGLSGVRRHSARMMGKNLNISRD